MPRVPLQSLVSARQAGVQVQAGTFSQSAQSTSNLVSSISGAAQAVNQHFVKAQEYKNRSDISDGRELLRVSQAEFQNRLTGANVPPERWVGEWEKELPKIRAGLETISKAPDVINRLEKDFGDFSSKSLLKLSGDALKENQRRAKTNLDRDLKYLYEVGDYDGANGLVDANRDLLGDDLADDTIRTHGLLKRKEDLEFSRNSDPLGHIERVNSGGFGKLSKLKAQKEVEAAQRLADQRGSEGLSAIRELEEAGLIEDEDDLRTRLSEDPYISEKEASIFIKNYRSNKPLSDAERYALEDELDELTELRSSPEEYEKKYYEVAKKFESLGRRGNKPRVNLQNIRPELFSQERLDSLSAKKRAEVLRPIQSVASRLVKKRAEGLASVHFAKNKNYEEYPSPEIIAANQQLKNTLDENAILVGSALKRATEDFITSFPSGETPTEGDISNFLDKNADKIALGVLREKKKKTPIGGVEGELDPESSEARGNYWRDKLAGSSILPNPSNGVGGVAGGTIKAQVTRYGFQGDKYQNHKATSKGSKHENIGNRNNILEENVSVALPPKTAKALGIDLKGDEFVEAKIDGKWQKFRVDDTAGDHANHRIDFYDPQGGRIKIDGNEVEIRKAK